MRASRITRKSSTSLGTDGGPLTGFGSGLEPDLSDLEHIGNGDSGLGFAEELADLDVPDIDGSSE